MFLSRSHLNVQFSLCQFQWINLTSSKNNFVSSLKLDIIIYIDEIDDYFNFFGEEIHNYLISIKKLNL